MVEEELVELLSDYKESCFKPLKIQVSPVSSVSMQLQMKLPVPVRTFV